MDNSQQFNEDLCQFLARATTPFHAVAEMVSRLEAAGFSQLIEDTDWDIQPGGRYYVVRNGSSIVAFGIGEKLGPIEGLRMVGAHTDSPCLMVKPAPERQRHGYLQLGVEVYGGALLNPWFDRDLSLAGRVSFQCDAGSLRTALIDFRRAIATIPSLAIHLDREANKNRSVNPQKDIPPILCQLSADEKADFREILREQLVVEHPGCGVEKVLDYEMCFYDTQPAAVTGLKGEFLASARLDNLLSCYTGLQALLQWDGQATVLLVCNDHEEVGSLSAVGAQGPMLGSVLKRLAGDLAGYSALTERSMMISADNAHGIHPNYADKHDENHGPLLNAGPVIKINSNQRYASNSETTGLYRMLAAAEGVPVQSFVVRTDMACGSTIGPITAGEVGVRTLDIGVPTFGMHSIRELAGTKDAFNLSRVLRRFYNHPGSLAAS
ncbi:M18 family aminopeptidase [Halioglobus japonicus]|uniref:M18 family aminopeptidase n=1 Tax=Halioglobus japonicus TaxID=930805 RepID=A0AAP8SNG6_9GAMM|nr:M18 family aminopeptidase [Halioglobus japonicus]AQA18486.1 M18 family aminopeptidase [Halioglobus japonicus]PLW86504.1 M18 family aminopeptidase [Halioglobus japonicus]GHD12512.1 putative M18 family aminopeptidase 2 [Halioglobus japonicus]